MLPDEKGVIFSQWTSLLDIIQVALDENGFTYTRIDGSMNPWERRQAMKLFKTDGCDSMETPQFILCSMHACGTGINLTRGNVVFMMDPWWNVAAENQGTYIHWLKCACSSVYVLRMTQSFSFS